MELQIIDIELFSQIIQSVCTEPSQTVNFLIKEHQIDLVSISRDKQLFAKATLYLGDMENVAQTQNMTQTQSAGVPVRKQSLFRQNFVDNPSAHFTVQQKQLLQAVQTLLKLKRSVSSLQILPGTYSMQIPQESQQDLIFSAHCLIQFPEQAELKTVITIQLQQYIDLLQLKFISANQPLCLILSKNYFTNLIDSIQVQKTSSVQLQFSSSQIEANQQANIKLGLVLEQQGAISSAELPFSFASAQKSWLLSVKSYQDTQLTVLGNKFKQLNDSVKKIDAEQLMMVVSEGSEIMLKIYANMGEFQVGSAFWVLVQQSE
ncbi:Hypothetical_protein [Hexamita inflata]|uniref:Hypothetical_protein n=1 Tax=Hexamita inflata TaxID=28002 RepID=A0AA86TYQ6_9EUKA|nr:Hypothetical protein HINF_LOCUS21359 [Hexamita inflata]